MKAINVSMYVCAPYTTHYLPDTLAGVGKKRKIERCKSFENNFAAFAVIPERSKLNSQKL